MANINAKKSSSKGLAFIWVLIILLVAASVGIVMYYNANHSSFLVNGSFADALSQVLDKPEGNITKEDLSSIERISMLQIDNFAYVTFSLEGYVAANEAYTAEGITDEEKKNLIDPSTLTRSAEISDANIYDDLKHFTGLTGLFFTNYTQETNPTDVLAFAAENFPALRELALYGYAVNDFSLVEKLPELTTLSVAGVQLTDISAVQNLKNLEILDLSSTGITDISALSTLDNEKIETVYLTGNNISDYSPIAHIDAEKVITDEDEADSTEETVNE